MRKTIVLVMFAVIGLGLTAVGSGASPAPSTKTPAAVLTANSLLVRVRVNRAPTCTRSVP